MKISEFKNQLTAVENLHFILPGGNAIPAHLLRSSFKY